MLFCPEKYIISTPDINEELLKLEGDLENEAAKISLAKFLRYNLDLTSEWICGVRLEPYQIIALKACLLRNYVMLIYGRGGGKSFLIALCAFLISIFEPGTSIIIAGPVFRVVKNIFTYLEKIQNNPEAILLKQCLGDFNKSNDLYTWKIGDSMIRGIPNNGQRTRGMRANVLFVDEFLQMSEQIVKEVLTPFMTVPTDVAERIKIRKQEDELIREGRLLQSQRTEFKNNTRMIVTSSASFSFEYLYRLYSEWMEKIYSDEPLENAKYFIHQLSWEAVPDHLISKEVIEEAKGQDENSPTFKREYCAQFTDDSAGFFRASKMADLTIKDGNDPTTLIKGNPDKEYIISIDPNLSKSPTGDFFAMSVLEIDKESEKTILVHNYGKAGADLDEYIKYFYYLLHAFNVVLIVLDNQDGKFIESVNTSALFQNSKIKLDFIEYDGDLKNEEYLQMLKKVRTQYNRSQHKICFKQVFTSDSVRRINEQLQTWIDRGKIIFASKLTAHENYNYMVKESIPYPFDNNELKSQSKEKFVYELIDTQDDWIFQVKKQCSLIEVGTSPLGKLTFDLPQVLRRDKSVNRCRKDNYTTLLLGIEAAQAYFNLMKQPPKEQTKMFSPMMFGECTLR